MPPDGSRCSEPLNRKMRIRPNQNVGTDQKISAMPVCTRSYVVLRFHAACWPSHRPSTSESSAALPVSSTVGPTRSPMSCVTGSW